MRPRVERWRSPAIAVAVVGAALFAAPVALADEAQPMYDPQAVALIELTLPKASEEGLEADPSEYEPGTFSFSYMSGPPGEEEATAPVVVNNVGIRLKGGLGSFRKLSQKAAFKLKFNEFVKGQKFLGLKKMTLNNMVQDPSMVHETLAYQAFDAVGVPVPRTGYAYVRVNGTDFGLYLNLETLDETALARIFGAFDKDTQHLYEAQLGSDVVAPIEIGSTGGSFEVDEGDDANVADLEALAAAAVDGPSWLAQVVPYANLDEMTRMWAVEKLIEHWDGYSGHAVAGFRPNNYYLYSDPSGVFQMLPWGTDQTWSFNAGIPGQEVVFDGAGGVLFNRCLADSGCVVFYREAVASVRNTIVALDLDPEVEEIANLLLPWQELEQLNARHEHDLGEIEAAVASVRDFIAKRPDQASEWLAAQVPDPGPSGPAIAGKVLEGPVFKQIGKPTREGGILVARFDVPEAGDLRLKATIETRDGPFTACRKTVAVAAPGERVIRCRMRAAVRERLRRRWLKMNVQGVFTPIRGFPQWTAGRVVLRRG